MAQKMINTEIGVATGTVRLKSIASINKVSEVKNGITALRAGMSNASLADCVYNITTGKNVYNTSDSSVPHGPATVALWLDQVPPKMKKMINKGESWGFVTGVTNPFILAGSEIILPSSEANFNHCVDNVAKYVGGKILDNELTRSRSSAQTSRASAKKLATVTGQTSSAAAFNAGNS